MHISNPLRSNYLQQTPFSEKSLYEERKLQFCVPTNLRPGDSPCEDGRTRGCGGIGRCTSRADCEKKCNENSQCEAFIIHKDNTYGYTSYHAIDCSDHTLWNTYIRITLGKHLSLI